MRRNRPNPLVHAICGCLIASCLGFYADPQSDSESKSERSPIPAQADQDKAMKLVKEIYADEYSKRDAGDRARLAGKLLEQAREEGNNAASRYVMLREARDIALAAGDVETALVAVDVTGEMFAVDARALRTELLTAAARKPAGAAQAAAIARAMIELAEGALVEADVDRANKLLAQAEPLTKKAKEPDLAAEVARRKKEVREFTAQFGSPAAAQTKLAESAEDAGANMALGRFYCFIVGDWEKGLPLLAKGSDPALRKVARMDALTVDRPTASPRTADAWWDLAEQQTGAGAAVALTKVRLRARAAYWYEQALKDLTGLERTRVEKRLEAIKSAGTRTASSPNRAVKAAELIEAVTQKMPAAVRPAKGAPAVSEAATKWVAENFKQVPLDDTLRVGAVDDKGNQLVVRFADVGPADLDGIGFVLQLRMTGQTPQDQTRLRALKAGDSVRVRGVIPAVTVGGWFNPGNVLKQVFLYGDAPVAALGGAPAKQGK